MDEATTENHPQCQGVLIMMGTILWLRLPSIDRIVRGAKDEGGLTHSDLITG